jgi:hypothetical protein
MKRCIALAADHLGYMNLGGNLFTPSSAARPVGGAEFIGL